jgi:zinc transport system substrate-binding protein
VVFWIGKQLTPALERHIETLAADAIVVALLSVPGTTRYNYREVAVFGADGDHHDGLGHDEHGHNEHGHNEHGHDEHGHEHNGVDAHAWLDPVNAARWLDVIAATLSDVDPVNAATYVANAVAGQAEIEALSDEIAATLASAGDVQVVVTHDAYQYFERRFGSAILGAIATGDAENPSPARIATLQDAVAESGASCVFAEPQYQDNLVRTVFSGDAVTVSVIDPLGAGLELGAGLYPALLRNLADRLVTCGSN